MPMINGKRRGYEFERDHIEFFGKVWREDRENEVNILYSPN